MSEGEVREVFFHRKFEVVICPENKDLTGITAGGHTMVFPIEMAEGLAVQILRVTQLQRECARTGDYTGMQKKLLRIGPNVEEVKCQQDAFDRANARGDLHEN